MKRYILYLMRWGILAIPGAYFLQLIQQVMPGVYLPMLLSHVLTGAGGFFIDRWIFKGQ